VIVAHLGNGASMCGMKDLKSQASTMGFTAVDGLMMGTRTGNLDPGVLLYLMDYRKMDSKALTSLLYKESGLLGVSGISGDMRVLLESTAPEAREAVDLFCYRIVREIGSLAAALGGLDALVFTGGIGEHGAPVREQVCAGTWLARIDPESGRQRRQRVKNFGRRQPDRGLRHTHERRVDYCAAHREAHRLSRHFQVFSSQ
jgi:acetate kinase